MYCGVLEDQGMIYPPLWSKNRHVTHHSLEQGSLEQGQNRI